MMVFDNFKLSDISVIVQGPIIGKKIDSLEIRYTYLCLKSIRKYLPGAEIILSTWKDSDISDLDFDILVENEDPGAVAWHNTTKSTNNLNRQIITTIAGIKASSRILALKIRSDIILTGVGFLSYFGKFERRTDKYKILEQRVIGCTVYSRNPRNLLTMPFHPSDWFQFGLRTDLIKIWDIPLAPEPETTRYFHNQIHLPSKRKLLYGARFAPEQYIWITFLSKYSKIEFEFFDDTKNESIMHSVTSIANNLVLVEPKRLNISTPKYQKLDFFNRFSLYSFEEWYYDYKKICEKRRWVNMPPSYIIRKVIFNLFHFIRSVKRLLT